MSPQPQPHTLEAVEQDVDRLKKMPLTVGMLLAIGAAVVIIAGNVIVAYSWVNGIGTKADAAVQVVDRKVDLAITQLNTDRASLQNQIDAQKTQRELSMRNRDLQLDAIKAEQDRQGKRQDAFENVVSDLSRKTERILVVVESLKDQQDKNRSPAVR